MKDSKKAFIEISMQKTLKKSIHSFLSERFLEGGASLKVWMHELYKSFRKVANFELRFFYRSAHFYTPLVTKNSIEESGSIVEQSQ